MLTIDTSVWVNAFDQREAGHEVSRQFLEVVHEYDLPVVVPNLLCVEIAAAISRTRRDPVLAQDFASALAHLPNLTLVPLDEELASQARDLAAQRGLRGADAVYAAVARRAASTLVSLDREHLTRLGEITRTCDPASALAEILELKKVASGESETREVKGPERSELGGDVSSSESQTETEPLDEPEAG